jgi:hypothetical protein
MPQLSHDARHFFFRPFYDTKRGHIVGLATTKENMRDGLAIAQIARFFQLPEYEGIVVEPGRKAIRPASNVILVGWAELFIDPESHPVSGPETPPSVGKEKLERIERLYERCCFQITEKGGQRIVVNNVTHKTYEPFKPGAEKGKNVEVDYGVIRRWFPNPAENTLSFEGLHRLGTLGATKVATDFVYLEVFFAALEELAGHDDSLPLEILVQAKFHHDEDEIYSMDRIEAKPLAMVYNGQLVYDLIGGRAWTDQLPWDVHLCATNDAPPIPVPGGHSEKIVPRVELRADLRDQDERIRSLCRELLTEAGLQQTKQTPPSDETVSELIESLALQSDRFVIELWDAMRKGDAPRAVLLPTGKLTQTCRSRKRFLIHMILCRLMGRSLYCTSDAIRRIYPTFQPELREKTTEAKKEELESKFIGSVSGKLRETFEALLGTVKKRKDYLQYGCTKTPHAKRTYKLKLDRAIIVLKIRV